MIRPGEDELIATLFAPMAGEGGLGLKDDAALLAAPAGCESVVTTDALVAGVHFFPDDPPGSIAVKALGVNLSDLAAKGAAPSGFVLTLALAPDWSAPWLEAFSAGLARASAAWGCSLLGGDTVRTPGPLLISVTAIGSVPNGAMVKRTGAREGDRLYVSGSVGDAALGLQLRSQPDCWPIEVTDRAELLDRYLHPQPRLALASVLRAYASGAMDVSDGLVGDAAKMLRASGCSGLLDLSRVPLSAATRSVVAADAETLTLAVTGGDDYEVLASVPPLACDAFEAAAMQAGVGVTFIGSVEAGSGPMLVVDAGGHPVTFERRSFSHF